MIVGSMIRNMLKSDTAVKIFGLSAVVVFGAFFILLIILMMMGNWKSPLLWVVSLAFIAYMLFHFHRTFSRRVFKLIGVCVLIGFMLVIPASIALSVIEYHSAAQLVATENEIAYFQNVLDRRYDHKELIVWEWQHIEW